MFFLPCLYQKSEIGIFAKYNFFNINNNKNGNSQGDVLCFVVFYFYKSLLGKQATVYGFIQLLCSMISFIL